MYSTHPFLWFKIEQAYDFKKQKEPDEKPFGPLTAELDLGSVTRTRTRFPSLDHVRDDVFSF